MIRIGIVDDHALVRLGIQQLCAAEADISVVGEADNGRTAIDLVRKVPLHVLVMDLAMPGQSGIDALSMIRAKNDGIRILIMTSYPEEIYAANLLRQGASGYLNKNCLPEELFPAIRQVASGKKYISPSVARELEVQSKSEIGKSAHESLTQREFQVFLKLAKGATPGTVAQNLSLSVRTVGHHRTKIFRKMELLTNSDLTYYAIKNCLID